MLKHNSIKIYEDVEVKLHTFLTSMLEEGELSGSDLCPFTPETPYKGSLYGPYSRPCWESNSFRPTHSFYTD
jgi:hypothetical protein